MRARTARILAALTPLLLVGVQLGYKWVDGYKWL